MVQSTSKFRKELAISQEPVKDLKIIGKYTYQKTIDTDFWLSMEVTPVQRNTEERLKKPEILENLSTLRPCHLHVAVGILTKNSEYLGTKYNKGQVFLIDGCTRQLAQHRGLVDARPEHMYASVYEAETIEKMEEIYRTYDNKIAVETTQDTASGILRAIGYEAKSSKIKNGKFISALKVVNDIHFGIKKPLNKDHALRDAIVEFINEFAIVDNIISVKKKVWEGDHGLLAAALMAYRTYANTDKRDKVDQFFTDITLGNSGVCVEGVTDGITFAIKELETHKEIPKTAGEWNKGETMRKRISHILYCLEQHLKGKKFKQLGGGWEKVANEWFSKQDAIVRNVHLNTNMVAMFNLQTEDAKSKRAKNLVQFIKDKSKKNSV